MIAHNLCGESGPSGRDGRKNARVFISRGPDWSMTRTMSTKEPPAQESSGTEQKESDGRFDTVDALMLEMLETARRQGFEASDVSGRLSEHSERLENEGFTPYEPPQEVF